MSDPAHDPAHRRRVVGTIHAGDAQTNRRRDDPAIAEGLLHHAIEDLLDFELAQRLEVGAAATRFGQDPAVGVGQLTDRLGAAGVDADDMCRLGHLVRGSVGRATDLAFSLPVHPRHEGAASHNVTDWNRRDLVAERIARWPRRELLPSRDPCY